MQSRTKTIFITITRGFLIRNILRSGVLTLLKKAGWRVVIFFEAPGVPANLREEFSDPRVFTHGVRVTLGRLHRVFLRLRKYLLSTASTAILIDFRQGSKDRQKFREGFLPGKSSLAAGTQKFLMAVVSRLPLVKWVFRAAETYIFHERNLAVAGLFDTYQPSLVFGTSVISSLDIAFLKEARRRRIPTVAMPKTWDNVMNGYFRFLPDYILAHNELAKTLLAQYQDVDERNISLVGMPQFDWYRKKEVLRSRGEHWERKGLDPEKAVIFFGSVGIWGANDHSVAELIYEWIERGELAKPCQLFLRPHFSNVSDDVFRKLRGKRGVAVDDYPIVRTFSDNWDPTTADTIDFANSIAHCDTMVNFGSTLTLDAACMDRPIVNPAFGCSFQGGVDVTYPYQYGADHYQWVLAENATALSCTPEELKEHLNEALLHPEKRRAERERVLQKLCYRVDGQASKRIVDAINRIYFAHHV